MKVDTVAPGLAPTPAPNLGDTLVAFGAP